MAGVHQPVLPVLGELQDPHLEVLLVADVVDQGTELLAGVELAERLHGVRDLLPRVRRLLHLQHAGHLERGDFDPEGDQGVLLEVLGDQLVVTGNPLPSNLLQTTQYLKQTVST